MQDSVFERIIRGELPAKIIFEDERVIAFLDINPVNPGHFLVVPKLRSTNLFDITEDDLCYLITSARRLALKQVRELGVSGFKLVINNGASSGQVVFHTHVHIIPSLG